jgi:Flp pilus assembly protein TadD
MFHGLVRRPSSRWVQYGIVAGAFVLAAGCATVNGPKTSADGTAQQTAADREPSKPAAKSFNEQRAGRRRDVVAEFDRQRDRAEYQAAFNEWQQGDAAAARETLAPVLTRNPDYREAHLLAAQLDLFDNMPKAALAHARQVLVAHPDDPQAHFETAMALDAMGAVADALPHYEKAARLAPNEDVYQVSYQSALTGAIPPPMGRAAGTDARQSPSEADAAGYTVSSNYDARIVTPSSTSNR